MGSENVAAVAGPSVQPLGLNPPLPASVAVTPVRVERQLRQHREFGRARDRHRNGFEICRDDDVTKILGCLGENRNRNERHAEDQHAKRFVNEGK